MTPTPPAKSMKRVAVDVRDRRVASCCGKDREVDLERLRDGASARARSSRERGPGISVRISIALVAATTGERTGSGGYSRPVDLPDLDPDPHAQFDRWFAEAATVGVRYPEQMALATATRDAVPSVRMVLLKGHDARGFVFYTNHSSRKAAELEANPRAARSPSTGSRDRQVRVEGTVERIPDDESFAYFRTRPRDSQIGAWASPQSRAVASRAELERRVDRDRAPVRRPGRVPLPPFWGGYRIVAAAIEFWQGQPSRLHDRLRYELTDGVWSGERLAP